MVFDSDRWWDASFLLDLEEEAWTASQCPNPWPMVASMT
jgi:hypothetical protein